MAARRSTEPIDRVPRYLDLERLTKTLDAAAVVDQENFAIGVGEDARELPVGVVSASFWSLFDATPVVGRFFTAQEDSRPRRRASRRAELCVLAGTLRRAA